MCTKLCAGRKFLLGTHQILSLNPPFSSFLVLPVPMCRDDDDDEEEDDDAARYANNPCGEEMYQLVGCPS